MASSSVHSSGTSWALVALARCAVYVFVILTLLFPSGEANKVAFAFLMLLTTMVLVANPRGFAVETGSPLAVASIFAYGYWLSLYGDNEGPLAIQFLLSVAVLFLFFPVRWFSVNFDRVVVVAGVILCLFTLMAGVFLLAMPDTAIGELALRYFIDYSMGARGSRSFGDESAFMFHAGTAPFLFLPFGIVARRMIDRFTFSDFLCVLLFLAAILATTSRALLLACIGLMIYLLARRMRPAIAVGFVLLGAFLALLAFFLVGALSDLFSVTETSNSIKVGHAVSYVDSLTLREIFLGNGLASIYFSSGQGQFLAHTEITLLDMMRYLGVPLAFLLYFLILKPTFRFVATSESVFAGVLMLIYCVISMTNPVLFNSYGLLVVVWYWTKVISTGGGSQRPIFGEVGRVA